MIIITINKISFFESFKDKPIQNIRFSDTIKIPIKF
jgi:hypothetical protein